MAMLLARRAAFARVSARSSAPRLAAVSSRGFAEGGIPATINLNFATPAEQLFKNFEAKMVTMKGSSGVFGVLPGHVPTIAQLQPGTVTVEYDSDEGSKSEDFFVSAGFAYIKANSDVDVCAVEACKVEDIDAAAVSELLAEANAAMSSGEDEKAKAEAQIKVEVLTAMQAATA